MFQFREDFGELIRKSRKGILVPSGKFLVAETLHKAHIATLQRCEKVAKGVFWVQMEAFGNIAKRLPEGCTAMLPYTCTTAKMRVCQAAS